MLTTTWHTDVSPCAPLNWGVSPVPPVKQEMFEFPAPGRAGASSTRSRMHYLAVGEQSLVVTGVLCSSVQSLLYLGGGGGKDW